MEDILKVMHVLVFTMIAALFLFQSIILFIRSGNNKARKTMAVLELAWGICYSLVLFSLLGGVLEEFTLFRPQVILIGNYFISFMLFFPMQVFLPGWLNLRRMFLVILPILIVTGFYLGGMWLLGETPENLYTYKELFASIGHFNVWFRFVALLFNFVYIFYILFWLRKYERKYQQWTEENYADQEQLDISWMRPYNFIIIGITIFYLAGLMLGGRAPVICHASFASCCFSYLFYKALFFENSYPPDFFAPKNLAKQEARSHEESDDSFTHQIPVYVETIRGWMETEKPFLYSGFKLQDVRRVVPLNRSYLSRVFNDGFGRSFSEVVRSYRLDYAKQLMQANPTMLLHDVAVNCGFSSDSTFVRIFKQEEGVTPAQYRARLVPTQSN